MNGKRKAPAGTGARDANLNRRHKNNPAKAREATAIPRDPESEALLEARHGQFRDLCMRYGDFNRPIFLEEVLNFLRGADEQELISIREGIRRQAKQLRIAGKRGRPRGQDDPNWRGKALKQVWQREILGWTWPKIASAAGMNPTDPNIRTLQRRRDEVAAMIWGKLPPYTGLQDLERILSQEDVQTLLHFEFGLPFKKNPQECRKLILKLAPVGQRVAGTSLERSVSKM